MSCGMSPGVGLMRQACWLARNSAMISLTMVHTLCFAEVLANVIHIFYIAPKSCFINLSNMLK